MNIPKWSYSQPDNDPPHRHRVVASCLIKEGQIKICTNIRRNVWWLTGSGEGFAGPKSRIINSRCTRSVKVFNGWYGAVTNGNVKIL